MPKVSVIVPVYNASKYLNKCLETLVNQTLDDIEIIAINDGSSDNSLDIMMEYQSKYSSKIKIVNNQNNGIGKTRNIGIEMATGEYLTFIDSDDYIDTNMLLNCYNYASSNDLEIVVCNYYEVNEKDNAITKKIIEPFDICNLNDRPELLFKINASPWNKLYRRSLFDNTSMRFPEQLKYEDMGLVLILLHQAKRIGYLDIFGNYYLIRSKSETTTVDNRVYDIFKILDIINDYYKNIKGFNKVLEYLNIEKILIYTVSQRKQSNKEFRNKFIKDAFIYLNMHFPNWKKNEYYQKRNVLKKIIETNESITKIYCGLYYSLKK